MLNLNNKTMKVIDDHEAHRTELKFKTKKEIREYLISHKLGYILTRPIFNGVDKIYKENDGGFSSFAQGRNWHDAGKSYHSIEIIINSIWKTRGSCWKCWGEMYQY
jgi:hypothetical protein